MTATNDSGEAPQRILIVEDEEIVLVGLRETLKREGYSVRAESDPRMGLEAVKQESFAVIITDHKMPHMTGLEFLTKAKEIRPHASRILITAVLNLDTVVEAINKGEIYRFIVKPWLREELLAAVRNAVQRYDLVGKNLVLQAATQAMNERLVELNKSLEQQVSRVAEQNIQLERLNQALQQNFTRSVELCLSTMQTFYPTLGSQARRVHELCRVMGLALKLSSQDQQVLETSAWLHDIGLVGVSRQLIKRWQEHPGSLTSAEEALIHQHPILGQELVAFAEHLGAVGPTIRSHHERFDGSGYPEGLQGNQIPWLSRLLAVAVAFAESNRDKDEAIAEIQYGAGKNFDPEAVRTFTRAFPQALVPKKEREVLLSELQPGMVLAKGIYTSNGMLLLPEGQQLSPAYIDKLRNHDRISPINQALFVYG